MTASQLATYDQAKMLLLRYTSVEDGVFAHVVASLGSGLVATTVCSPVDVVKTRVMAGGGGEGVWRIVRGIVRKEGVGWVFRGWLPSFVRLGPHTVVTFVALEQHKKGWRWLMEERGVVSSVRV